MVTAVTLAIRENRSQIAYFSHSARTVHSAQCAPLVMFVNVAAAAALELLLFILLLELETSERESEEILLFGSKISEIARGPRVCTCPNSKFEGWKTLCMTLMKQKFQMRMRMPCSNCLCKRGGMIRPYEIITKGGGLLKGGGGLSDC